jgi:hypothetical protein
MHFITDNLYEEEEKGKTMIIISPQACFASFVAFNSAIYTPPPNY